jgi:hypothetical protein
MVTVCRLQTAHSRDDEASNSRSLAFDEVPRLQQAHLCGERDAGMAEMDVLPKRSATMSEATMRWRHHRRTRRRVR